MERVAAAAAAVTQAPARKAQAGRRLWSALWLVASPLLLWLYLQRVEVLRSGELRAALLSLRAAPLLLAVVLHLLLVVSKGRRLSLLLRSARPGGAPPLRTAWLTGMYLGSYAMDNLLFSQAGVGSRVLLLQRAGVPLLAAVGSQVLDKVLEGLGLLVLLPLCGAALQRPGLLTLPAVWPARTLLWLGLLALLLLSGLWALRLRLQGLWRLRLSPALADAVRLAEALRAPRLLAEVLALTLLGWALELAMVTQVARAFAAPWSAGGGAVTLVLVSLAMLVPGLPANVGPFEAAATLGFQAQGLAPARAFLAALVYHAAHTVPVTLIGLPLLRWLPQRAPAAPAEGAARA